MAFDLAQSIGNVRQARDERFFNNLLQFAMTDDLSVPMPSKTQLWNEFSRLKGGRMAPEDLQRFESAYAQVKSGRYQKQLNRLGQLSLGGMSDKKIQNQVKNDPELYQSLLDLVTEGKNSGTEEGIMMAAMGERFLPKSKKSLIEKFGGDEASSFKQMIPGAALAGGVGLYQYLSRPDAEDMKEYKKDKAAYDKAKAPKGTTLPIPAKDVVPKPEKPKSRWEKMTKGFGKGKIKATSPLGILGYTALSQAENAGEYIAGEEARPHARTLGNLGMLGLSLRGGWLAPLLAAPPAMDLYRQYTGDE